jgi:hypothetical protein
MGDIDTQLEDFRDKIRDFRGTLSDEQILLFDAILRLAWRATTAQESVGDEFEDSFEPHQAGLIVAYDHSITATLAHGFAAAIPRLVIKP